MRYQFLTDEQNERLAELDGLANEVERQADEARSVWTKYLEDNCTCPDCLELRFLRTL